MSLELYNTTSNTRTIPKYRYNGKVTLQPKGTMDIEDYMSSFYKPYSSIGVVVRVKSNSSDMDNKEVMERKVAQNDVEDKVIEETKEVNEDKGEGSYNIDSSTIDNKEDEKSEVSNTSDDEVVSTTKKYTKESLMNTKMKDLREFATSLGIENIGVISKESLCDKILEFANA